MLNDNKTKIARLLKLTYSTKEIARIVGLSPRRVNQIKKELEGDKLTLRNYFVAVQSGEYATKQQLAELLGVCRKTLYKFEIENHTKELFCARMLNAGASIETVQAQLGLTNHEANQLKTFPTIASIKKDLTKIFAMLQTLKDAELITREEMCQYQEIKRFLTFLD